jgi:D-alanyl-D-alanine carboxypeptidase/D-alanyl-D-alanine-endopeptidase (penicillin-binding protein 4)
MDIFKKTRKNIYVTDANWNEAALGRGWAWDDYNDDYMPERSVFPVYGNMIRWVYDPVSASFYSIPDVNWDVKFSDDTLKKDFYVQRDWNKNLFTITEGKEKHQERSVPFITEGIGSALQLLKDTVGRAMFVRHFVSNQQWQMSARIVHTQPVDSLFRPMMHRSDNFFAEQTLLMVSNERLGLMNDARIIDTLLKTDLKDLPQAPHWVDGSGLSRNDLFTPRDFIWLLDKMKNEFGLPRLKVILPTGGTGTLANYYKKDSGFIYAKTGSLSGVVALSGYLITKKDHLLLFSILVNNSNDPAVRRKIERLVEMIREKY